MPNLDTLTVRFEADARALMRDLDSLDQRLDRLQEGKTVAFPSFSSLEMRLTVAADEAISRALQGAGDRLSQAVTLHETAFSAALSDAQRQLAAALDHAVSRLSSSIQVTVPVSIDGARLSTHVAKRLREQSSISGAYATLL